MPVSIVVMGVAGTGKTTLASHFAHRHPTYTFYEGDNYHTTAAVDKLQTSQALSDEDREPWLAKLADILAKKRQVIMACSALKRRYRDYLRASCPDRLVFVYLRVTSLETVKSRVRQRAGHVLKDARAVEGQSTVLEEPLGEGERSDVLPLDACDDDLEGKVERLASWLSLV